jgi:Zn-dependent protease
MARLSAAMPRKYDALQGRPSAMTIHGQAQSQNPGTPAFLDCLDDPHPSVPLSRKGAILWQTITRTRGVAATVLHLISPLAFLTPWLTNLDVNSIAFKFDTLIILLIAIDLHELGHALTADWLGDDTPRRAGHITLNPLPKMGQFGILMLLILSFASQGFAFGFTPVNEAVLARRNKFGPAIVALAGPCVNLLIAIVVAVPLATGTTIGFDANGHFGPMLYGSQALFDFMNLVMSFNLLLFVMNLIPLPPLDGWTIFAAFLSPKTRFELRNFVAYGPFILLLLFVFDPQIHVISNIIYPLTTGIANGLSKIL